MRLIELGIEDFLDKLAGAFPTPGGGSAAALAAALSAALCAMVTRLTMGREKYRDVWQDMERVCNLSDYLARQLLQLVDKDADAYNQVMVALGMSKEDDDQRAVRREAIKTANKQAALVPMEILWNLAELVELVREVADKGNPNCITDAGVAAQLIRAAAMGAAYNVRINLLNITDETFSATLKSEEPGLLARIKDQVGKIEEAVERNLG